MAQDNSPKRPKYVKSKNETIENIVTFYALGSAAESILKHKVVASCIQHKARTKALVTYIYDGPKPSKDDQDNIESLVNQMISSKLKLESNTISKNDCKIENIPQNIDNNANELYKISITNGLSQTPYTGVSHLPVPDDLGILGDVKVLKFTVKKNKFQIHFVVGGSSGSTVQTTKQTKTNNANKNENNKSEEKSSEIVNKVNRNQKTNNNELLEYSQDIVDKILYDLRNELNVQLSDSKLDELVANTRHIMNQFQNLTYTRAVFAAKGMKKM